MTSDIMIYNTSLEPTGTREQRKKLYEAIPKIEQLKLNVEGYMSNDYYLRPSIKSISMNFTVYVAQVRREKYLEFLYPEAYLDWFHHIKTFLKEHPESELEELHIQFDPLVRVHMLDEDHIHVGYDKYGPLYEDEEWTVKTDKLNPSDYFCYLTGPSKKELIKVGDALLNLLRLKSWKAITLPYHFPSAATVASQYPFVTFTDARNEQESITRVETLLDEEYDAYFDRQNLKPNNDTE